MRRRDDFTLQRNLYENCIVRDLDGQIIFYCSSKRAAWYLNRKLAAILNKDPLEIQLNFKTNGPGNAGDPFYLQYRKNMCVVCGGEENLTRHHVVPFCFRRFFPDNIKNHSYHDILLLCVPCHENYEQHARILKNTLGEEYKVSIHGEPVHDKDYIMSLQKCRSYAHTLLFHKDKIPLERQEEIITKIKYILKKDDIDLDEVAKLDAPYSVHVQGKLIVEQLTDIKLFAQRWRMHFVETMSPKFLPEHWSIDRIKR